MNNVSTPMMRTTLNAWPKDTQDYVKHTVLRDYIQETSKKTGVEEITAYNTSVESVHKVGDVWHVETITIPSDLGQVGSEPSQRHWV